MALAHRTNLVALFGVVAMTACTTTTSGASAAAGADKVRAAIEGQTAPDGTLIKCRSIQVTGSRFPAKDCKSEKAWQEFDQLMAENAKNETDKFQRVNTGCSTTGTC
ncbi:hypothetical protein [Hyphomonas sp.]|uniref:hypothetical protein n=1 Tax=Hyphomonas sp. TaxID=87 RepID=UPI001BCB8C05|nr:hypothetical protein [Hyphomonas sp.]